MIKRIIFLLWGLFLFGIGIVMTIKSNLGTAPWDALHLGLIHYLPFTLAFLLILLWLANGFQILPIGYLK